MTTMRTLVVTVGLTLALGGGARTARGGKDAPEVAGAKKLLAEQAKAIEANDPDAFVATFVSGAFVFMPTEEGLGATDTAKGLREAMSVAWVETIDAPQKAKPKNVLVGSVDENTAWITADLEMTSSYDGAEGGPSKWTWTVRLTEIAVNEGGAWKAAVAHFSVGMPNKAAFQRSRDEAWEPLMPIPGAGQNGPLGHLLESGNALAEAILVGDKARDKAVTVIGTDAKEKATGSAKAVKMLKGWNSAAFEVDGKIRHGGAGEKCVWAAANLKLTVTVKKEKLVIPMRVLLIGVDQGENDWRLVSAHFSN